MGLSVRLRRRGDEPGQQAGAEESKIPDTLTGLVLPLTLSRPVKGLLVWLFFVVPSSSFGPWRGLGFRVDVFRKVDCRWRRIGDRTTNPHRFLAESRPVGLTE